MTELFLKLIYSKFILTDLVHIWGYTQQKAENYRKKPLLGIEKDRPICLKNRSVFLTEMERFELSRRFEADLPHFECGPFSHLGTSPYLSGRNIATIDYITHFAAVCQLFFHYLRCILQGQLHILLI